VEQRISCKYRALHDKAIEEGQDTYKDPDTGFKVLTTKALRDRGKCCFRGCRHCPYEAETIEALDMFGD